MTMDQLTTVFGWDFDKTEIKAQEIMDGFSVLFGLSGNIAGSVGEEAR